MERETVNFLLAIMDWFYVLDIIFIVIVLGIQIIHLRVLTGLKMLFFNFLTICFVYAVIGHFLIGLPVEFLLKRYILEGYKLLPILYYELIEPIFKVLWPS